MKKIKKLKSTAKHSGKIDFKRGLEAAKKVARAYGRLVKEGGLSPMKKLNKSELKPDMKVRHKITGSTGALYGKDGKLYDCIEEVVMVRRRIASGKNKGRLDYVFWNIENIELIQ